MAADAGPRARSFCQISHAASCESLTLKSKMRYGDHATIINESQLH